MTHTLGDVHLGILHLACAVGIHTTDRRIGSLPAVELPDAIAVSVLAAAGGSLYQSELAALMRLDGNDLTALAGRLTRRGWVHRYPPPRDRRIRVWELTDPDRAAVTAIRDTHLRRLDGLLNRAAPTEHNPGQAAALAWLASLPTHAEHTPWRQAGG